MQTPVLVDVTPRALVVETVGGWCDVVVQRNAKIPCERTRAFTTSSDMQTAVRVRVAQGEDAASRRTRSSARSSSSGCAPRRAGEVTIRARFEVDESGTLKVFATDVATGREAHALLQLVGIAEASVDRDHAGAPRRCQDKVTLSRGPMSSDSRDSAEPREPFGAWLAVLDDLTYYELFGLDPGAGADDVRAAFHVFCDTFHPDRHFGRPDPEREAVSAIFKRGTEAYLVLGDVGLRGHYDARADGSPEEPPAAHPLLAARPPGAQPGARSGAPRGRRFGVGAPLRAAGRGADPRGRSPASQAPARHGDPLRSRQRDPASGAAGGARRGSRADGRFLNGGAGATSVARQWPRSRKLQDRAFYALAP